MTTPAPIYVAGAIGHGLTDKSAFDDALTKLGIADFNLINLSSVIPRWAGQVRKEIRPAQSGDGPGDRLYCVMAKKVAPTLIGLAAGVGWSRHLNGRGVFVEHQGTGLSASSARSKVDTLIQASLPEMIARRGWHPAEVDTGSVIVAAEPGTDWRCALVVAAIETSDWTSWPAPGDA